MEFSKENSFYETYLRWVSKMTTIRMQFDIKNALIDVCGRSFWYKQPLFDLFARAGLPEEMYLKYEHEPKFKLARQLIGDLESMGEDGWLLQKQLLTEFCKLRNLPDSEVPNKDAGIAALRRLKELAIEQKLFFEEEKHQAQRQSSNADIRISKIKDREQKLSTLQKAFTSMVNLSDHQARGYGLEDILCELFAIFELRYRKSYRTEGEQIDGFFAFGGFDYIVEARWRSDQPTLEDLLSFKGKVDRKIESTRGFFVSMPGFRSDTVQRLREAGPANLVLTDGYDITLLVEGRVNLIDGLQAKIDKASQEGILYFQLSNLF
jgi:hypothetical protein